MSDSFPFLPASSSPSTATPQAGEVIAAATTAFTAQCLEIPRGDRLPAALPDPPPLGAFVRVGGNLEPGIHPSAFDEDDDPFALKPALPLADDEAAALYGIVVHSEIGALEAGRSLVAFGLSEEELRQTQPHIYELLATRFTAVLIGYEDRNGTIRAMLPPRPPRPHAPVYLATNAQTLSLTKRRLDFLRGLLTGSAGLMVSFPSDDVVAAVLRRTARAHGPDGEAFLMRAGRELAALLPNDYDRLRAIIGRVVG